VKYLKRMCGELIKNRIQNGFKPEESDGEVKKKWACFGIQFHVSRGLQRSGDCTAWCTFTLTMCTMNVVLAMMDMTM